jgi:hypothetical protein
MVHCRKGELLLGVRSLVASLRSFRSCRSLFPARDALLSFLATSHRRAGDAVRSPPQLDWECPPPTAAALASSWNNAAVAALMLGEVDAGVAFLRDALTVMPDHTVARKVCVCCCCCGTVIPEH